MANEKRVMFVHVQKFDGGSYRGCFLTTDLDTHPLEYRCSSMIKPTQLQQIVYGGVMLEHMFVRLLADPLFKAASQKPDLVLVREPLLLGMRSSATCPVLLIRPAAEVTGVLATESHRQIIEGQGGKFEAVLVESHQEFLEDRSKAQDLLTKLCKRNPLKPFQRAAAALAHAHKEGIGG